MKTLHSPHQLQWHLQANVFSLSPQAITGILTTLSQFNEGKLTLSDPIAPGAGRRGDGGRDGGGLED